MPLLFKTIFKKIGLTFLFLFFTTFSVFATTNSANKTKIENIKKEIKQKKEGLRILTIDGKNILSSLEETKKKLNKDKNRLKKTKKNLKEIELEIGFINSKINVSTKKIESEKEYVNKRIKALYKLKVLNKNIFLFSSNSIFDFIKKQNSINKLIKDDLKFIKKHLEDKKKLAQFKNELKKQKKTNLKILNRYATQQKKIIKEKKKLSAILQKIKNKKNLVSARIKVLEKRKKALNKKIISIIKKEKTKKRTIFKKIALTKPLPISGKIISSYGYKIGNGIKTFQSGIVIKADIGEPIASASKGKIIFAKWFKGYGNMLIVKHPKGFFFIYAYLETMFKKVGDKVMRGEVIATVGKTGALDKSALYFEMRFRDKPQNPIPFFFPNHQ